MFPHAQVTFAFGKYSGWTSFFINLLRDTKLNMPACRKAGKYEIIIQENRGKSITKRSKRQGTRDKGRIANGK